jgi:uncharacterized membrane protein YbhN (UPF0104 family)
MVRTAFRWGVGIGIVNMLWLYLAYYLGLHTNGIYVFQVFMLVWLLLTVAGYVLALRAAKRENPSLAYLGGLAVGVGVALVSAAVAVVAQIGYFKFVHPEWPHVMAQQTREHFSAQGLSAEDVESRVQESRNTFTLTNYAVTSAITALVVGAVLSGVIMLFLRRRTSIAEGGASAAL